MTILEIRNDATFTDQGRQALSLFRLHVLKLQRDWKRSSAPEDLEEIGRRAIIYNELIEALEDLITPSPQAKTPKRKRLHPRTLAGDPIIPPKKKD